MESRNDYLLVFYGLQMRFDEAKIYGGASFAPIRSTCNEFDQHNPSIQFVTKSNGLLMFDIFIDGEINNYIINKWHVLSTKCTFLFIVVPKDKMQNIEITCCKEGLSNYQIVPFYFNRNGNNRDVIFENI